MMRTLWYAGLLLLTGIILSACQSGDLNIGQSVINPQQLLLQPIDTVTILASTVLKADSFATSSDNNIVVGHWSDAQTGQLTAKTFTSVDYPSNSLATTTNLTVDSLVLELGYAFSYGDTTTAFTLNVHKLKKPIVAGLAYYNTSTASYEENPLVSKTIVPNYNTGTQLITVRFPDTLAQSLFTKIQNNDISSNTTLAEMLPGFAFVGQSTVNSFRGFANSYGSTVTGLRLYYHSTDPTSGVTPTSQNLLFTLSTTHFTELKKDLSNTPLKGLKNRSDAISSQLTDNTTFISWGSGLQTRLELPYLDKFLQSDNFAGINGAFLVVSPVRKSLSDNAGPPTALTLYGTNSQNEVVSNIPGTSSGQVPYTVGYSVSDTPLMLKDTYTFDLTAYIGQIIRRNIPNRPLLLTVASTAPSVKELIQRVTLGNQQKANDQMKLQLYFTSSL
ncbi:DUF4270 family protein [Spirosoma sp. SC4-14]|uniref:DUF4270 family protein n=1 Tax=Spirosoma sp. SC4-14 TaxID=3128900 RepID=UPI0030D62F04